MIVEGPNQGLRFELEGDKVLGRRRAAIIIDDPEISGQHALIRATSNGLEIRDLGSLNGTFVNGERVRKEARILRPGDLVKVGKTVMSVHLEKSAPNIATLHPAAPAESPSLERAAPMQPPARPFGSFAPVSTARRRSIATRRPLPIVLSFGVIIATSILLIAYFWIWHR